MSDLRAIANETLNYLSTWVNAPNERGLHPHAELLVARLTEALQSAATPEPTLDAERLAQAIDSTEWPPSDGPNGYADWAWVMDFASRIAAEYARLHERTER